MTDELRSSLDTVRTLSSRLNQITDQANDAIRQVESFLASCNAGVDVAIDGLRYTRIGRRYRIAIGNRAWSDSTRDQKLKSFAVVPRLIEAIAEELAKRIETKGPP